MTRLIDADKIDFRGIWGSTAIRRQAEKVIEAQPTVDAVEVVHAKWSHSGGDEWFCTNCCNVIHTEGSWEKPERKFCDECGAEMSGGAKK